ncbi:hypothetical protein ACWDRB_52975 [Nonomuraea sp. NPDC003707]
MTQTLPPRTGTHDELRQRVSTRSAQALVRAAARGAIGSMAMSGLRQFTTAIGLVAKVPPEAVLERTVPRLFHRVHHRRRPAMVELAHWGYGTAGGALYGVVVGASPWPHRDVPEGPVD